MGLNKGQKLVKIIDLMSRRNGVTAGELMERFELDPRSLRRYLADLRELEVPVVDEGRGPERTIGVDPSWRRTGVTLSLAEVLSLHFGRKLFNFLDGTSFAEDLSGAIERLEPAISRAHRDLAEQLDSKFLAVPEPAKDYGRRSDELDEVITALVYNNPIDTRYRKASGVESRYLLHPYTLATFRQGLYLFALDVESPSGAAPARGAGVGGSAPGAAQVKTYAVERFVHVARRRAEHFNPPPGWRPEAHIAHAFGIISGDPVPVVLAFTEAVAAYIKERTWHPSQSTRALGDGRLELRMRVALTVELVTWILGFGPEAQVLGPPELVDRIIADLRAAREQYR